MSTRVLCITLHRSACEWTSEVSLLYLVVISGYLCVEAFVRCDFKLILEDASLLCILFEFSRVLALVSSVTLNFAVI